MDSRRETAMSAGLTSLVRAWISWLPCPIAGPVVSVDPRPSVACRYERHLRGRKPLAGGPVEKLDTPVPPQPTDRQVLALTWPGPASGTDQPVMNSRASIARRATAATKSQPSRRGSTSGAAESLVLRLSAAPTMIVTRAAGPYTKCRASAGPCPVDASTSPTAPFARRRAAAMRTDRSTAKRWSYPPEDRRFAAIDQTPVHTNTRVAATAAYAVN